MAAQLGDAIFDVRCQHARQILRADVLQMRLAAPLGAAFTIKLVLVRMPRWCPSMMPRLTPRLAPKSSPLTIRYFMAAPRSRLVKRCSRVTLATLAHRYLQDACRGGAPRTRRPL